MLGYTRSNIVGYGDHDAVVCPKCAVEEFGIHAVERTRLGLDRHEGDPLGISAFELLDGARCAACSGFFPTIEEANA